MALLAALASPARADTEAGLTDFRQGQFAEALQEWRAAADAGDPRGALFVGVMYDTGLGVGQDEATALDWYRRAAASGSAAGAFNAGVMYDAGRGAPRDLPAAAEWYERAAAMGFARAEYNLGLMYESGSGVPRSRVRAEGWFSRAARHGIAAARTHLASLGGDKVAAAPAAEDPAMRAFQQAQDLLLARGPAEAARAVAKFREAAGQQNALAEYDLGYCYEHGMGVPADPAQADAWYRRAASHARNASVRALALVGAINLEDRLTPPRPPGGVLSGGVSAPPSPPAGPETR